MKLKRISAILAASVIALSFAGCSSGGDSSGSASASASRSTGEATGEKTKLYVVNWKDYGSDDQEFMKEFEETYNCEIVNTYMSSEEELLTKLRTSKAGEIDVCLPNCTILPAAIEDGLLEQIDTSKLENFDSLFERFKITGRMF